MKRSFTLAVTQMACSFDPIENQDRGEYLVRKAASQGANIILLQELFERPYFCKDQNPDYFNWALPVAENPLLNRFSNLAKELEVVIPLSFFESAINVFYNSMALLDADGSCLGIYRKSHIPDGPGYQEKYYFTPGSTGFKVWDTQYGKIGVGICWDQWFPEAARAMVLKGAELLLYPTAIGSEPQAPLIDTSRHWQRVMQGHASANLVPVAASNRIGHETGKETDVTFYGNSFICGPTGELLTQAGRDEESVLTATLDFDEIDKMRKSWGVFRDRRPELYQSLVEQP